MAGNEADGTSSAPAVVVNARPGDVVEQTAPAVGEAAVAGAGVAAGEAAPTKPRSAAAIEKEQIVNANYAKHKDLSDEELAAVLPKREDGSLTSIGAILHADGNCSACSFFHFSKKGCNSGIRCRFCHGPHEKKEKKRKQRGRKKARDGDVKAEAADSDSEEDAPRKDLSLRKSAQLHWDGSLGAWLDRKGNSRPRWLEDEDLEELLPALPPASGGFGCGSPGWPAPAPTPGYQPFAPPVWQAPLAASAPGYPLGGAGAFAWSRPP